MSFFPIETGPKPAVEPARGSFGPVTAEDLMTLARIGYDAVEAGRGAEARPIFELLMRAQPENAAGAVGMALAEYGGGSSTAAIQRLRDAARNCTVSVDEAKAALAVILMMEGRRGEAAQLRAELLRGPDSAARTMVLRLQIDENRR